MSTFIQKGISHRLGDLYSWSVGSRWQDREQDVGNGNCLARAASQHAPHFEPKSLRQTRSRVVQAAKESTWNERPCLYAPVLLQLWFSEFLPVSKNEAKFCCVESHFGALLLQWFWHVGPVPGLPFLLVLAWDKSVVPGESYRLAFWYFSMAVTRLAHSPLKHAWKSAIFGNDHASIFCYSLLSLFERD